MWRELTHHFISLAITALGPSLPHILESQRAPHLPIVISAVAIVFAPYSLSHMMDNTPL